MTLNDIMVKILIPQDKANHVIYGAVTAVLAVFVKNFFLLTLASSLTAVLAAVIIGATKELADAQFGGDATVQDFIATSLGGVLIALALLV